MKHLGDISKIRGYEAPIVDVIIGGSPCQDLSIAGKRAGLDGERSGLFMEQVRIAKEMRDNDRRANQRSDVDVRPRYMVWENVAGALSSPGGKRKGEDFRCVLEELARVVEPTVTIPMPKKWERSGCIVGNGWSIAWRLMDAQYWGVPQRRRRICLVEDFNGYSAPEIVFGKIECDGSTEPTDTKQTYGYIGDGCEPQVQSFGNGLQGYSQPGGEERKDSAGTFEESVGRSYSLVERAGKRGGGKGALITEEKVGSIATTNAKTIFQPSVVYRQDGVVGGNTAYGLSGDHNNSVTTTTTLLVLPKDKKVVGG